MRGKVLKTDSRNRVLIKPPKQYLSLSAGVIGGWIYFNDHVRGRGVIILSKWVDLLKNECRNTLCTLLLF